MRQMCGRVVAGLLIVGALVAGSAGCESMGFRLRSPLASGGAQRFGPGKVTMAEVQSEVMSFADTYTSEMTEKWNEAASAGRSASGAAGDATGGRSLPASPTADSRAVEPAVSPAGGTAPDPSRTRRAAHERKLASVSSALSIASSPNPMVALSDMITMVSLERMRVEEPSTARTFGAEAARVLLAAYRKQEERVWRIASRALTQEQQDQLEALIAQWREQNPDQKYVSRVRLEDFARARQVSTDDERPGGSLLSLIMLDPLAGLDPATREVEKSRMLAERIFFYSSRMPNILKWQMESLYEGFFRTPEMKEAMDAFSSASDAAGKITQIADRLPKEIAAERQATLDQIFAGLTAQRQALRTELDQSQDKFQGTLKDFRSAVESTKELSESLTKTLQAADLLAARVVPMPGAEFKSESKSDGKSDSKEETKGDGLADYRAAAAQTADAADRLAGLVEKIDKVLNSPALEHPDSTIQGAVQAAVQGAVAEAQKGSVGVIDHAFGRLLILVVVGPFAVVLAMGVYRWGVRK